MRILLTNDDGFHSVGINELYHALLENGHQPFIVAPDRERSAIGHAITMHYPLRTQQICESGRINWLVNGTPSDCVKLAIEHLLLHKSPELIISGINQGPNFGRDVLYSGTVAAALEGSFYNIPSLAASLASYSSNDFIAAASFLVSNLELLLEWSKRGVLNINFPVSPANKTFGGARFTKLGNRLYQNVFEERIDPRGQPYFWMAGEPVVLPQDEFSDLSAVEDGFVSITPLQTDLTDYEILKILPAINNLIV